MLRKLLTAAFFLAASPVYAQAQQQCLSNAEARQEAQEQKLVSVQQAIAKARERAKGDLLSAHLCRQADGLIYRISILARDGRVARLLIDAGSGHFTD